MFCQNTREASVFYPDIDIFVFANHIQMTHTYRLTGMTCGNCEKSVKQKLLSVAGISNVELSHKTESVTLTTDKHISVNDLQNVIGGEGGKYKIGNLVVDGDTEQSRTWLQTYKPILLIFAFITGVTFTVQMAQAQFDSMEWMRHFMAGFFLVFAFFKVLDIHGFASSYAGYDIIARRFYSWGLVYPFIEIGLGLAYLANLNPLLTNALTFVVMTLSIIGVIQSVLNKRKIKCACLGIGFNLPMSTVTIIEDGLMILMSAVMLTQYL